MELSLGNSTISSVLEPRKRLMLLFSLLFVVGSCKQARDDGKGEHADPAVADSALAEQENARRQLLASSESALELRDKIKGTPYASGSKGGLSYLVVLASWKLSSDKPAAYVLDEVATGLSPQSVKMAKGFPRPADAQESAALRSGYGAMLAGVCSDSVSARKALEALRAERFDAYLKETELRLSTSCPLPARQWQLDHELLLAAESDKPDALDAAAALLHQGASPHGIGTRSPLDLAAYQNDVDLARLLLERGARVNNPHRAPQQESALELALRTPHGDPFEMVQLLVKHGADVNARTEGAEADPGSTVQLMAIRGCYPQILMYLREKGARPHSVSGDEVCRDRLPSQALKSELSAILGI